MKKILHITEAFSGGVFEVIHDICEFTCQQQPNVENHIGYAVRDGNEHQLIQRLPEQVTTHQLPLQRELSLQKDRQGLRAIINLIEQLKPDLIHCHSAKAGVLARIAAKLLGIPCFYTPHGYAFMRQDVSMIKRKLYYLFEWLTAKLTSATTIACGQAEYQQAQRLGKAVLITNGLYPQRYQPTKTTNPTTIIGTVGRITHQKGVQKFKQLTQQLPNSIHWYWIGDGELRHELEDIPNLTITGWLAHDQAINKLNSLDIYCQTSLWEGLPLTVLEAMALAKPVILSNIPGHRELLPSNQLGYLANSTNDFCHHINTLINQPELANSTGAQARNHVLQHYNWQMNLPKYLELYFSL